MIANSHSLPEISAEIKRTWKRIRRDYSAGGVAYRRCFPDDFLGEGQDREQLNGDAGKETQTERTENTRAHSIEIALIATRGGKRWQLPKGSREGDESPTETAIREVEEEAGLKTVCEGYLKTIDYWYWDTYRKDVPELVHKTVDFYLLRVVGGTLTDQCYEVDAAEWFSFERAMQVMTFEGELEVVRLAMNALGG